MKERAFLARLDAVDRQVAAIETLAASLAARIRAGAVDPEHLHTLLAALPAASSHDLAAAAGGVATAETVQHGASAGKGKPRSQEPCLI